MPAGDPKQNPQSRNSGMSRRTNVTSVGGAMAEAIIYLRRTNEKNGDD